MYSRITGKSIKLFLVEYLTEHETPLALLFVHVDATICHRWPPVGCGRMPLSPRGTRSAHIRVTGCCVAALCSARHAYALDPTGWGRGIPTGGAAGSVRLPGPHPETGERN